MPATSSFALPRVCTGSTVSPGSTQCEELLAKMAAGGSVTAGLTVRTGTGSLAQHPIYRVAVEAVRDMLRYAAEFGLTPSARSRVSGGIATRLAPSKFDGLLG